MTIDEAITYHNKVAHQQIKNGLRSQNDIYGFLQCAKEHKQHAEWLEKLKEYEDLEEQGRLIKLPCKVGDVVYVPTRDFISELRIVHISIFENNTFLHWTLNTGIYPNLDGFLVDKIGKTVFLTEPEAEAKLKELRGRKNE